MEVAVAEEKKKIFRARKTMKISDRQQLETLHSTLLSAAQPSSSPSPPPVTPVVNGTHKEEGQKVSDKEQNDFLDSNSSPANSPVSPASRGSPPPSLSLNLSPSPTSSQSPKAREDTPPASPFQSINFDLKNTEEGKKASLPSPSNGCSASSTESKEGPDEEVVKLEKKGKATESKKKEINTTKDDAATAKDSLKPTINDSALSVKEPEEDHRAVTNSTEPMETDVDTMEAKAPETSTSPKKDGKTSSAKAGTSLVPASSSSSQAASVLDQEKQTKEGAKEVKEEKVKDEVTACKEKVKKGPTKEIKMEVDHVKAKTEVGESSKPSRPTSTPPSDTVVKVEKNPSSQLKRTLSEGEKDGLKVEREGKRPKVELEAQLELKITAKANSRLKLEKIVQQLVAEQLKAFECTVVDKGLQELKDRVEKIDCATKHQHSISTLQAKITRIAKKFGEANQASENRRKQEALAAASAKTAAATAAAAGPITPVTHRLVRTTTHTPTTISTTNAISSPRLPTPVPMCTPTSTTMVPQTQQQILQLIASTSNATNSLATAITTQSSMGTLLLKTANGGASQGMLFQLPLSMTNCQPGTLVNIPVSSLPTVNSLNKAKTTTTTTTFILKPAHAITTAAGSVTATVPALQASAAQMSQMTLARAVYQGGAGGISTPNAGVSVTTARAPTQSISLAGAMSSSSSPATSGPAATGSTAPGPPQGTSMTSKTDNQATSSTPAKPAVVAGRPKGSVIDLTEDDDDVQVTGVVKNATAAPASVTQRPHPVISVPNSAGTRSSPQSSQNSGGNPQTTVHHRAPVESPAKSRAVTTSAPTRAITMILPPLPTAPQPVGRLPAEATQTSPPQQPQLKLVPSPSGIVLSWCVAETDLTCATVDSYHLYAFHQDNSNANSATQQHWKKIGEVKALPLPMACTLTQFQAGSTYHFAVRAKDIYGRFGSFCDPQCTNVISPNSG